MTTIGNLSEADFKKRLNLFKRSAQQLCGRDIAGKPLNVSVPAFFDALIADIDNPEVNKARAEFLLKAQTDKVLKEQLCAIRIMQFSNYLLASNNVIPFFFNIVNLADDERPVAQNNTTQEIRVSYVGEDGASDGVKIVKPQEEELIPLHWLSTDEIRYRKVDLYRGSIADAALATIKLAYDMGNKMDSKAWALLTASVGDGGCFGTINYTTGSKPLRVVVPNSRVVTANLPTTNDISLSDNGTGSGQSNLFRYKVFPAIVKYCQQWGNAFAEKGPLTPTGRILVPGADPSSLAAEITPSGATRNAVADKLLEDGFMEVDYLGILWKLIPDNTLHSGACYAELSRKPGQVFLKPGLDREKISDSYENDRNNEEARYAMKPFGTYINSSERINALRIIYNSTYSTSTP